METINLLVNSSEMNELDNNELFVAAGVSKDYIYWNLGCKVS